MLTSMRHSRSALPPIALTPEPTPPRVDAISASVLLEALERVQAEPRVPKDEIRSTPPE